MLALLIGLAAAPDPEPPLWPERFHAMFAQATPTGRAVIHLYYDFAKGRNLNVITSQALEKAGKGALWDFERQDGLSFFFTPRTRECRTIEVGYGLLRPSWLRDEPVAELIAEAVAVGPYMCNVWIKGESDTPGVPFITYYAEVGTGRPVKWVFFSEAHAPCAPNAPGLGSRGRPLHHPDPTFNCARSCPGPRRHHLHAGREPARGAVGAAGLLPAEAVRRGLRGEQASCAGRPRKPRRVARQDRRGKRAASVLMMGSSARAWHATSAGPLRAWNFTVIEQAMEVHLSTTIGEFVVELYPKHAPRTARNFYELAKRGYYDGVVFHRIVREFCVQGGDPTGTGRGGESVYGKQFEDELTRELKHTGAGILSMANSGPNTNGSQFFITLAPQPSLDGKHTIFGRVRAGMETVKRMGAARTDANDRPIEPIRIIKATALPFSE